MRISDWSSDVCSSDLKRKESGMATISKTNGLVGGTLASDIHHRLREDIVSCVLEPGQRLRFEQLKEIYGASYSTLREALSSLVAEIGRASCRERVCQDV